MRVDIWTDGSCYPNPGPAGWAAILVSGDYRKELSGHLPDSTNIRAEITAAIEAVKSLKEKSVRAVIHTDSAYVKLAIEGMDRPRANLDLLAELKLAMVGHIVSVEWVRGHTGDLNNERCDQLAKEARLQKEMTT